MCISKNTIKILLCALALVILFYGILFLTNSVNISLATTGLGIIFGVLMQNRFKPFTNTNWREIVLNDFLLFLGTALIFWGRQDTELMKTAISKFDFMDAFTLGSFSLIIVTALFHRDTPKRFETARFLSAMSCVCFFISGLFQSLIQVFFIIVLSGVFDMTYIVYTISLSLAFVAVMNLVVASIAFIDK